MKSVNEVLEKFKGAGKTEATITGKGSFSRSGFSDLVSAYANDTTAKVKEIGKDGKEVSLNISELIRADLKKSAANAKYPQKSEAAVYDTSEVSTAGIAQAIPRLVLAWLRTGRKLELPAQKDMNGSLFLQKVPAKTKTVQVRDIKTKEELGTTRIENKEHVQLRAKSPVPKALQTKTRFDKNGKPVQ